MQRKRYFLYIKLATHIVFSHYVYMLDVAKDSTCIKSREFFTCSSAQVDFAVLLGREEEDSLVADYRARLTEWQADLKSYALTAGTPHHPGKADIEAALSRVAQQLAIRDSFAFIEALLAGKDEWPDTADDIQNLVNFYKTQITAWRKLLDGLRGFESNREALNKAPQAATALTELTQIRDNPKPYGQVNRIEPLVATVTAINEELAQSRRESALLSIDSKIAEVQAKLSATGAAPALCNKVLHPLQGLKTRIASQTSIAQIMYLQDQGGAAMDDVITLIEEAAAKPPRQAAAPGDAAKPVQTGQPNVPLPVAKTTRVIRAADFSSKTYLETEADVDAYVAKLKDELLAAIRAGQMAACNSPANLSRSGYFSRNRAAMANYFPIRKVYLHFGAKIAIISRTGNFHDHHH